MGLKLTNANNLNSLSPKSNGGGRQKYIYYYYLKSKVKGASRVLLISLTHPLTHSLTCTVPYIYNIAKEKHI